MMLPQRELTEPLGAYVVSTLQMTPPRRSAMSRLLAASVTLMVPISVGSRIAVHAPLLSASVGDAKLAAALLTMTSGPAPKSAATASSTRATAASSRTSSA